MLSLEFPSLLFEIVEISGVKALCTPVAISECLFICSDTNCITRFLIIILHLIFILLFSLSIYSCNIQNCLEYNHRHSSGVPGHNICTDHLVHSVNTWL